MKTFSAAVTVAVVLVFICIQQSSATSPEVQELEEAVSSDNAAAEHQEQSADSWMMPQNRQKRDVKCGFCCKDGGCGVCCNF
ncbi:hepcidin [Paralichthys olivaceus]|uniref:Hepcidin 1 n=1 Tax=Paralichthys olivaceus TaxID=8255 RepID=Q4LEN9_PAROL|nr:PREDICTED: hepcidin-like [Paralichthys olivaceus]BAE06232.1 hepcidin 1 [Paralichthys olivaceus]BAE06234.1 hepcidin 1 [Paralichthys olivaceus]